MSEQEQKLKNTTFKTSVKIKCFKCNEQFDFNVYPLIDLQKNTELYNDLFSLNLFKHECPHCKTVNILQYNTLIIDAFKKYMVYLFRPDQINNFRKDIDTYIKSLNESKNQTVLKVLNGLKHTRVVISINNLLQKLLIFDYDLNDKIIELLKQGLYENKLVNEEQFDCIVFDKIEQDKLLFTCFSTKENKVNAVKDITVELTYYNALIDALGKAVNEQSELDFPMIDKQWARNIINLTRNNPS